MNKNTKTKSVKDAIHGYIQIEEPFWKVIDTIEFQRLKWIEQTSYRVLYPSARHDRFIHSIGTYHLAQKAYDGFCNNISDSAIEKFAKDVKNSFFLACLLHDIGHAPFSHTGEGLFNYKNDIKDINATLHQDLLEKFKHLAVSVDEYKLFEDDYKKILRAAPGTPLKAPAPHEVMSCIITVINFPKYNTYFKNSDFGTLNLDLIIRTILGCTYTIKKDFTGARKKELGIKNCFIRMLNSSMVDVDKLDYISRDTAMSGYENIIIDNDRLLSSTTVINNNGVYYPAFKKSALSVIENVVLAKNAQSKWIVSHPIVIYESFLLESSMGLALKNMYFRHIKNTNVISFDEFVSSVFNYKSLCDKPNKILDSDLEISLLSDIDILAWMKTSLTDSVIHEYFSREHRKKPIWKSQAEFEYVLGKEHAAKISEYLKPLLGFKLVKDISKPTLINKKFILSIEDNSCDIEGKEEILKLLYVLDEYSKNNNNADTYEFVILPAQNNFSTKIKAEDIYISFDKDKNGHITYDKLVNQTSVNTPPVYSFFYIYSNFFIQKKDFLNYLSEQMSKEQDIYM